jgi:hypothetical protein
MILTPRYRVMGYRQLWEVELMDGERMVRVVICVGRWLVVGCPKKGKAGQ